MLNTISLLFFTVILAIGQLLFKKTALAMHGQNLSDGLILVLRQPSLYFGVTLYALSVVLWVWILSRVPLAMAYPWVAVGIILVPLLSWITFGEKVNLTFWIGAIVVCCGVLITQYALIGGEVSTGN